MENSSGKLGKMILVVGAIPINLKVVYPNTDYQIVVPTDDSIRVVRDLVRDLYRSYTVSEEEVDSEKLEDVMNILSEIMMIHGQNKLLEWGNLFDGLKLHKFEYAFNHPCLWDYKKRLMFFDHVYSLITSNDGKERSIAYEAVINTNMFDDDWTVFLDDPHEAPLKRVFKKYGNVFVMPSDDVSPEEKRWAAGKEMIFFMKNCFENLTEVEIGPLNVRLYAHIDFMSDDPLYKDMEYFNHMATHFLYPKLWIELYAALYIAGYKFGSVGML